jgi:hypothetical protein
MSGDAHLLDALAGIKRNSVSAQLHAEQTCPHTLFLFETMLPGESCAVAVLRLCYGVCTLCYW